MALPDKQRVVRVRKARATDAQRIAKLSGQLGYPAATAEIAARMRKLKSAPRNALFVAESPATGVAGWAHVSITHLIEAGTRAELNALVVSETHRSRGVGAQLLAAAEAWARRRGCFHMSVRSNVLRKRAHSFYLRYGYEHYKTQKAFRKML